MNNYRVMLRSKPGQYEQYDGHVDVRAEDVSTAIEQAIAELREGAFPDRTRSMWIIEGIVII